MNHSTASFYNRIAGLYPAVNLFLKSQKKRMIESVNKELPGRILEIGIGDGSHLPLYQFHQIVGIDISETMLKKARRVITPDTKLMLMNGENMSFPEKYFDYIILSHVIAVTENPGRLIEEVFRVLKPGGKLFILNHFTPANWLRYVDWSLQPVAALFHLKSCFYIQDITGLQRFRLVRQVELGIGSYFKLLIFKKP